MSQEWVCSKCYTSNVKDVCYQCSNPIYNPLLFEFRRCGSCEMVTDDQEGVCIRCRNSSTVDVPSQIQVNIFLRVHQEWRCSKCLRTYFDGLKDCKSSCNSRALSQEQFMTQYMTTCDRTTFNYIRDIVITDNVICKGSRSIDYTNMHLVGKIASYYFDELAVKTGKITAVRGYYNPIFKLSITLLDRGGIQTITLNGINNTFGCNYLKIHQSVVWNQTIIYSLLYRRDRMSSLSAFSRDDSLYINISNNLKT